MLTGIRDFFSKKLQRYKLKNDIVIVSGLPRSGTSLMMKMLEMGSMPILTDGIREADEDNPKGYYEFERVKKLPKGDTEWLKEARGKAVKIISALLFHLPDKYSYRIIFMNRRMPEILASQRKMLLRRGEDPNAQDDEELAVLYENHLKKVKDWLKTQPNIKVLEVNYNKLILDPLTIAREIDKFLSESMEIERMISSVDPSLYRNRTAVK